MEKLIKLHELAKNHPFRLDRMGTPENYGEILDKLGEEFCALVKKSFLNSKIECPFEKWIWAHQYWSCVLAIKGSYKKIEEYMVVMESYLLTIHSFYESGGKLDFFYMHVGYSSYSKKQYEDNPMRSLKFVFYPQLNKYDVTKFHARAELLYYQRWLKERKEKLEVEKEKFKLKTKEEKEKRLSRWGIEYYESRISYLTRRVAELKTIISFP